MPGFAPTMTPATVTPVALPVKRREILGWCCFDFANSAFTTIVITVVYAVYFRQVVAGGDARALSWWGTALSLSQLSVILLSPWIGAIADVTARKKQFLLLAAGVCSVATMLLAWIGPGHIMLALGVVMIANFAFSVSENLCASFLPEISTPQNVGRISGFGWSFGYFGGLLSLGLAWVIMNSGEGRVPWTFVMTGLFFLLACTPTLLFLRERAVRRQLAPGDTYLRVAWRANLATLRELPRYRTLAIFFVAFTLFMAGLSAVIAFAALFGNDVLHLSTTENILLFSVLQITSAVGAFGFGFLQDRVGPKATLLAALGIWLVVSVWAAVCSSKLEFFLVGSLAGIGLGSLQAASRAVVSTLTPPGRSGEFFGFWGLFGKLGGVIGYSTMGWSAAYLGFRSAVLINGVLFLLGFIVVSTLALPRRTGFSSP